MTALASTAMHQRAVRGGSFSRTGRGSGGWVEAGPGPGAYQSVEKAVGVTLQSQPAYSFGSGRNVRSCKQPASAASRLLLEAAKKKRRSLALDVVCLKSLQQAIWPPVTIVTVMLEIRFKLLGGPRTQSTFC